MLKDFKERFYNLETFFFGPYLCLLGLVGIFSVQHFVTILGIGILCYGCYTVFGNRIARLRAEKKAVEK